MLSCCHDKFSGEGGARLWLVAGGVGDGEGEGEGGDPYLHVHVYNSALCACTYCHDSFPREGGAGLWQGET